MNRDVTQIFQLKELLLSLIHISKFRYTERPDTVAASVLEGQIAILVDNSPAAMLLPTTIFDVIEEADDYYFPPVTGTYLRLARMIVTVMSLLLTPLFLLYANNPEILPDWLMFTKIEQHEYVPIFWQLLILELAVDGLKSVSYTHLDVYKRQIRYSNPYSRLSYDL